MMKGCSRCAEVADPVPKGGVLYLLPPVGHASGRVRACLARFLEVGESPIEGIVAFRIGGDPGEGWIEKLVENLTPSELDDTRVLLIDGNRGPSPADLMLSESLSRWIDRVRGRYVTSLIDSDRIGFHFQPIVHSRDPGSIFAFECLLRAQSTSGEPISPLDLYRDARRAGLLFPLDRAVRLAAIREAVSHKLGGRLFINFNPSSIYDPATCLRSTVAAINEAGLPPGRVTFEIVESEHADPALLADIVGYYRSAGFRVALDDLGAGYSSLNLLHALRPDFIKLDRELTSGVDTDPYKSCITAPLIQMASALGIGSVAEGVETEGELDWLRQQGVDYIQGYLIARPGLPPFEIGGWKAGHHKETERTPPDRAFRLRIAE
jgi:EAL domain-containing protein (putative c-di-GMP-specific phosphodiesterase class I)